MSLLVRIKNKSALYLGVKMMGLIIKKRFGPRNFVQYLGLKEVYTVGTKAKVEQQEFIKDVQGIFTSNHLKRKQSMRVSNLSIPPDMGL